MRLSRMVRCISITAASLALFTGALSIASAQDATAEPTEDAMMSQMHMMDGACPEGGAATWFGKMSDMMAMDMGTEDPGMMATDDVKMDATDDVGLAAATMEATHDMGSMDMATVEPDMMATDDMGMAMEAKCLVAEVHGSEEVPGPGDEDAWGVAFVSLDAASGNVCYDIMVGNITLPASANHIHAGEMGVSGGVVIPFPTAPDAEGKAWGCLNADPSLVQSIVDNPASYYYNVHTTDFPDGAARGQFWTWDDAMTMWSDAGMDTSEWMSGSDDMSGSDMGSGDMSATMEPNMDMTPMATAEASG